MAALIHTKTKGNIGETFVLANLIKEGFTVSIPYGENSRYDFIIETFKGFKRIQVKYMSKRKDRGCYILPLKSIRANKNNNRIVHYTSEQVDFIIGYCPDNNSCYIIPMNEINTKNEIHIWVDKEPKGKNQHKPIDTKFYKNNWKLLNE
ncbi:hypothetical protein J4218_06305 [Candidatus Pacearchaeota archaeon]|nr:hypothetical protein [Candidatus Pacearchaeota archaeon]